MAKKLHNQRVLITGGSSGIGLATARLLAQEGAHIWLLARRESALQAALGEVESCRLHPEQRFGILAGDVAQYEQIAQAIQQLESGPGLPDVVVHSAGIVHPGYVEALDLDTFREQMEVNYLGSVHIAKAVLPGMLERGTGALVFIASMAAIINIPGYTAYGASKFAVRGFCDALRAEVKRKGIDVSLVFPPDTDTPQLDYEKPIRPPEASALSSLDPVLAPEEVARYIIKGIKRRQYIIIPGFSNQFFYWLFSALGPLAYPVLDLFLAWAIRKSRNNHPHPELITKKDKEDR